MTKAEIQALIDAKIAGQGSATDQGGGLAKILHEILEAAFAGANGIVKLDNLPEVGEELEVSSELARKIMSAYAITDGNEIYPTLSSATDQLLMSICDQEVFVNAIFGWCTYDDHGQVNELNCFVMYDLGGDYTLKWISI